MSRRLLEEMYPGLADAVRQGHERGLAAWEIAEMVGGGCCANHVARMRRKLGLRLSAEQVQAIRARGLAAWHLRQLIVQMGEVASQLRELSS